MDENITQKVGEMRLEDDGSDENSAGCYNVASYLGQSVLLPEHKAALLEILRCAVCLEVPYHRPDLQVKCCKSGHHFCTSCHGKLKSCAICRGTLENGRNFVVEEIINKLGHGLGISNVICFEASQPPAIPPGAFQCPHCCHGNFCSPMLLPHIRDCHSLELRDKLRTNPNTKWFQYNMSLPFSPGRRVLSFHVSEMGLLTFGVILPEEGSDNPIYVWIQALNKSDLTYQVLFTTEKKQFFGVSDQNVLDYAEAGVIENYTKLDSKYLFKLGEDVEFSVVVHTPSSTQPDRMMRSVLWRVPAAFMNDRKYRRTVKRNIRRTKCRTRYRQMAAAASSTITL